jgi:hypothetical protein
VAARFAVVPALTFAARFTPRAWRGAFVVILLAAAAIAARALVSRSGALPPLVLLAAQVLTVIAAAALYRLALRQLGREPPDGLAWAAVRLAATQCLVPLFLLILTAIALVALLAVAYGVASSGSGFVASDPDTWAGAIDSRGRWVLGAVGAAALAALAWVWVRLSLALPATIDRGEVQALSAWPLTRGRVAPILACVLALNAPLVAALFAASRSLGGPAYAAGAGAIVAFVMLPLNVGLMTYLYGEATPGAGPTA